MTLHPPWLLSSVALNHSLPDLLQNANQVSLLLQPVSQWFPHKSPELMAFRALWGLAAPLVASFQVYGRSVLPPWGHHACSPLEPRSLLDLVKFCSTMFLSGGLSWPLNWAWSPWGAPKHWMSLSFSGHNVSLTQHLPHTHRTNSYSLPGPRGYTPTKAAPVPRRAPGTHRTARHTWFNENWGRPAHSTHVSWKGLDSNTLLS